MNLDYEVLDVFTDTALTGNPLAVFTDAAALSADQMQAIAREMSLSETVFVLPPEDDTATARVRIFTPRAELPFAGHPVLGAALTLAEGDSTRLETGAGMITVELDRERGYGEMEQPQPTTEPFDRPNELLAALGLRGDSELPIIAYRNGPLHVYVAVKDDSTVSRLEPDMAVLSRLDSCCVSCFALAPDSLNVKTRVFCPALGVPEDPATGSAAGPLALHLTRHDRLKPGQLIEISQGEEIARPSKLYARIEDDRVFVGGAAVKVAHGTLTLP
jgi:trans-2,3-dihydro-3-hydroxyanthranilate isomerase